MNTNHTLPAFAEPITDLADQPNLTAQEMKRRLQAPAEELRQAHNALAETVGGITSATYPNTVTRDMLAGEVRTELDAKAEQSDFETEVTANTAAHTEMQTQISSKCEIIVGSYAGTGTQSENNPARTISLGFQPKAVLVMSYCWHNSYYKQQWGMMALPGVPAVGLTVTDQGFQVKGWLNSVDSQISPYRYIAFR